MRYEQWNLRPAGALTARRQMEQAGLRPLPAAVLCARGLDTPGKAAGFLSHGPELLHDPYLLRDMDKAAARIRQGLEQGETIAVYGDYDVDGVTSACLLTEFLREQGGEVIGYIPDRTEEGYGLNAAAIERLREQNVSLIITVDCGITAVDEVELARALGVDVVITDHHRCKAVLPAAVAVVNPCRPDCPYPFKELAGVGVALKVALALTPEQERDSVLRRYGELAAIGTVADVMRLTDENRALVWLGLNLLGRTSRPGLRALLRQVGGAEGKGPTAVTVSYGLAPRINAAGRMERAMVALETLLTRDEARGEALARELCELNRERQAIELAIYEQCLALVDQEGEAPARPPCIVLAREGWNQGVVGIVASRLVERYACPAFIICLDKGKGKGSCRSFGGFHLFAALEQCADLLESFGGHGQAAGFTILEDNIPALTARLNELVSNHAGGRPMADALDVDVEIDHCGLLSVDQVEALSCLEPSGPGNPRPVFLLRSVSVMSCGYVGGGRHLKMKVRRNGVTLDAIFFTADAAGSVSVGDRLDLVFFPQINEFRGRRTVQLQLLDLRPSPTRASRERELVERLLADEPLSHREAAALLPHRDDFVRLWRYLERSCSAGPSCWAMDQLIRQADRSAHGHSSYGRSLVCFHVLDEQGLIHMELSGQQVTVRLCRPEGKVDLEQARLIQRLRAFLDS